MSRAVFNEITRSTDNKKMRAWEKDEVTVEIVVRDFREHGTQGIKELEALTVYLNRLDIESIKAMYYEDKEATLEILVNCYGNSKAFEIYEDVTDNINIDFKHEFENVSAALNERQKQDKQLELEKQDLKKCAEARKQEAEAAEREVKRLKKQVLELKAEIYDIKKERKDEFNNMLHKRFHPEHGTACIYGASGIGMGGLWKLPYGRSF